jgi:hypothetical protein
VRWLSIFSDPRIWAAILIAAALRAGWAVWWSWTVDAELAAREAALEKLSPEERMEAELRTADALAREVLGVELGVEAALAGDDELERALQELTARPRKPPAPIGEIPVIRFDEPRQQDLPAWLVAGAFGAAILVVGAAGSWTVLRMTADDESSEPPTP